MLDFATTISFTLLVLHQSVGQAVSLVEVEQEGLRVRASRKVCGPVSVWYCLQKLGCSRSSDEIIGSVQLQENGMSLQALQTLSTRFGAPARAVQYQRKDLSVLPCPSILVVGGGSHCIVFEGLMGDGSARIFEPSYKTFRKVPVEQLQAAWTGTALVFGSSHLSGWGMFSIFGVSFFLGYCLAHLCRSRVAKERASERKSLIDSP